MKNLIKTNAKKGFSLVELLVVIAVIGVIAAIAIPAMSGIFGKSETAKSQRNAQNIAGVYAAGIAAGATATATTTATAIAAVTRGSGMQGNGAFSGSYFVAQMADAEANTSSKFLKFNTTTKNLEYDPDGLQTAITLP